MSYGTDVVCLASGEISLTQEPALSFRKAQLLLGPLLIYVTCFAPCASAQATLPVKPGLVIPNDDLPWALDKFKGIDQLIPVHRSSTNFNNHTGANLAGAFSQSFFYKPKLTTELPGVKARTVVHDPQASFYFRNSPDPAGDGNPNARAAIVGWEIVKATVEKDKRVFQQVRITTLTNQGKRVDLAVDSETEQLPGGWTKITPKAPLQPGEYAIAPIFRGPKFMSGALFDFTLNLSGENPKDAVFHTEVQEP